MFVVDGRHKSVGMSYIQVANIFYALGCEMAVNLDGGGSSEILVRIDNEIKMGNSPSGPVSGKPEADNGGTGGTERPRLNAWALVKK